MRSINKVILIGNLTRDPEVKQTPNGQTVVTFSIATNREWVTRDGTKHTSAEFHDLVAWAKLADICSRFLKKSKLVYVEGYLKTRSWDTPEGVKKFRTEVVVQDLIMLDKRSDAPDFIPEEEVAEPEAQKVKAPREETVAPGVKEKVMEEPEPVIEPVKEPTPPAEKVEKTVKPAEPKVHEKTSEKPKTAAVKPAVKPTAKSAEPSAIDIDQDLGL